MKITPVDISHKSFSKKMFGLDEHEVYDFLTQVANQIQDLIQDRNALREILRTKDIQIAEFKERDQTLKSTINTASQMADKMRADAEREAKLIIADAQQKAEIVMRDSRDSLKNMYHEMAELKKLKAQFEASMKAMAQAHLNLIEKSDSFMPQMPVQGLPGMDMDSQRSTQVSPLSHRAHV